MLQLDHRFAFHGLRPTLVLTRHVLSTTPTQCSFPMAAIFDGFDDGGIAFCADSTEYLRLMEAVGSYMLVSLLLADNEPIRVLVYDSHLPWARRVAREVGVAAAAFFTEMYAMDLVYGEVSAGRVALPLADGGVLRGRLSMELGSDNMPSFVAAPVWYPAFTDSALSQFDGLDRAYHVLVNSFHNLEPMELQA